MHLDIRLPIGLMFSIIGIILTVYGAVSSPIVYQRSLNININLVWGLVLLLFGVVMLCIAWRAIDKIRK